MPRATGTLYSRHGQRLDASTSISTHDLDHDLDHHAV